MTTTSDKAVITTRYIEYKLVGNVHNTWSFSVYPAPGYVGPIPRFLLELQAADYRLRCRPEWLVQLVALGRLGEYDVSGHPPQVFILWMNFDSNGEFIEFSDFKGLT